MELLGVLIATEHNAPSRAYLEQTGGGEARCPRQCLRLHRGVGGVVPALDAERRNDRERTPGGHRAVVAPLAAFAAKRAAGVRPSAGDADLRPVAVHAHGRDLQRARAWKTYVGACRARGCLRGFAGGQSLQPRRRGERPASAWSGELAHRGAVADRECPVVGPGAVADSSRPGAAATAHACDQQRDE